MGGNKRINITYRDYRAAFHPDNTPKCKCGIPTVLRVVQKKRENYGRYFWMCHAGNVPGKEPCAFFLWAEFDDDGDPVWRRRRSRPSREIGRRRRHSLPLPVMVFCSALSQCLHSFLIPMSVSLGYRGRYCTMMPAYCHHAVQLHLDASLFPLKLRPPMPLSDLRSSAAGIAVATIMSDTAGWRAAPRRNVSGPTGRPVRAHAVSRAACRVCLSPAAGCLMLLAGRIGRQPGDATCASFSPASYPILPTDGNVDDEGTRCCCCCGSCVAGRRLTRCAASPSRSCAQGRRHLLPSYWGVKEDSCGPSVRGLGTAV